MNGEHEPTESSVPWVNREDVEQLPPPPEGYERVVGDTGLVFDMPTTFGDDMLSILFNAQTVGRTDPPPPEFVVLRVNDPIRQHLAHPHRSMHFVGYAKSPQGDCLWVRFVLSSLGRACVEQWPLGSTVTEVGKDGVRPPLGEVEPEDVRAAEAAGLRWKYKVTDMHLHRYYPHKQVAEWDRASPTVAWPCRQTGTCWMSDDVGAHVPISERLLASVPTGPGLDIDGMDREVLALPDSDEVEKRLEHLRVDREAKRLLAEDEQAGVEFPAPVLLGEFIAEPDDECAYRVAGLWPTGGRVMLAARMKSGKTTLGGNLVRALADGDLFLGEFEIQQLPPGRRVVLVDNEMDPRTLRRWLRAQKVVNVDAVAVLPLRGRVATFDLLNPASRRRWVEVLRPLNAEILIFDCLRPVLDALGLSEDKDAGRFLVAFDALLAEAGIGEAVVVHHMGHAGERSRGDSRLRDWPDVEWKLLRQDPDDDRSPVFFSAFGRDVDMPEGQLTYDPETRRLTFSATSGGRIALANESKVAAVVAYVAEHPGASTGAIEGAVPGDSKAVRSAVEQAVETEKILRLNKGNAKHHYALDHRSEFEAAAAKYNTRKRARGAT
jgi:AAA domain